MKLAEPSAVLLFGLELIGMAGVTRIKNRIQCNRAITGCDAESPRQRSATPLFLVQFRTPLPFEKEAESIGSAFVFLTIADSNLCKKLNFDSVDYRKDSSRHPGPHAHTDSE
jgi:hypothetical protein